MTARSLQKRNTNPFGANSSLAFGLQLPKKHQTQKMLESHWYHSNIHKSPWLIKYDRLRQSKFKVLSVHQAKQSQENFLIIGFHPFDGWSTTCSAKSTKKELAWQKSSTAKTFRRHSSDKLIWLSTKWLSETTTSWALWSNYSLIYCSSNQNHFSNSCTT